MKYMIREIEENDIESGDLLAVLASVAPVGPLGKPTSKKKLNQIQSNPLHRMFVVVTEGAGNNDLAIGTAAVIVEPKFLFSGGRVGYIEDVLIRPEYQRQGVGAKLVRYTTERAASLGCVRTIVDCSNENIPIYK